MKPRYVSLDARIYLRESGVPVAVVTGLIALRIAGDFYLAGYFKAEFSNRSMHHAYATIERVSMYRPGRMQAFNPIETFVFRLQGQQVESPAPFHATPGEPVKVDYTIGPSGKIYVWKIDRGEPQAETSFQREA